MFQRKTFIRKSKVFPLVKQTGWKPNPHTYRKAVGTAEVVCGAILAFVPGRYNYKHKKKKSSKTTHFHFPCIYLRNSKTVNVVRYDKKKKLPLV